MKKLTQILLTAILAMTGQLAYAQYNPTDLLLVFHQAGKRDVEIDLGSVSNYLNRPAGTVIPVSYDKSFVAASTNFNNNFTGAKYALVAGDDAGTLWLSDYSMGVTPADYNANGAALNLVQGRLNNAGTLGANVGLGSNAPISLATASGNSYTYNMTGGTGNQVSTLGGQATETVDGNYGTAVSFYQFAANAPALASLVGTFTMDNSGNLSFVAGEVVPVIRSSAVSGSVTAGGSTTLSVSVDGATGYQWYHNGVAISGATNSSLTVNGAPDNAGSYYAVASNATYGTSVTSATGTVTVPVYNPTDLLLVFHQAGKRDVEIDLGSVSNYLNQPAGTVIPVSYDKSFVAASTNFNNNFTGAKYALVAGDDAGTLWLSDYSMGVTPADYNANGAALNLVQGRLNSAGTLGANVGLANGPISLATASGNSYTYNMTGGTGNQVSTLGGQATETVDGNYGTAVSFYQFAANAPALASLVGTFTMDNSGNLSFVAGEVVPVIRSSAVSGSVTAGGSTTLSVSVDGATGYQWYHNGVAISGATNSSLTVDGAPDNAGSYYAVASNATYGTSVTSATGTVTVPVYNPTDLLLVFHQAGKRDVEIDLGSVSNYLNQPAGTVIPVSYDKSFVAASTNFNNNFTSAKYALVAGDDAGTLWLSDYSMGVTPVDYNANGAALNLVQGRLNNAGTLGANLGLANGPISLATASGNSYTYNMTGGTGNQVSTLGGQATETVDGNYGTAVSFYQFAANAPALASLVGTFTMDNSGNLSFVAGQIIPIIRSTTLVNTNINGGSSATYSVNADGATTYQWYRNAGAIAGATSSSYTVSGTAANIGSYYVVASNTVYGTSVTSGSATVTVTPVIATQPASVTNNAGTTATFTVAGSGAGSYQWYKGANSLTDSGNVSGSTTPTLTLSNVLAADAANYTVVLSNSSATATSSVAVLTVIEPVIVTQPASQLVKTGNNATFTVAAAGTGLTYQWKQNGSNAPFPSTARTASLTVTNAKASGFAYSVVVSNSLGQSVTSATAYLGVNSSGTGLAPTVKVTAPVNKSDTASASILLAGTATDKTRVSAVKVSLNGGAFVDASVSNAVPTAATWGLPLTLATGTNTVRVKSVSFIGLESAVLTNTYFPKVLSAFNVVTNTDGAGTVVIKPGLPAYIGRTYTITATPGATSLLSNIVNAATSGTTITPNSTPLKALKNVTVLAQASNTVTINFVTNRFIAAAGSYNGLFTDTNHGVAEASAGFLTVKTTGKLTYSGSLNVDGDVIKGLAGTFDLNGASTTNVSRSTLGKSNLVVTLQLGFDGKLSGSVSNAATAGWSSTVDADQAPTSTALNGSYTLLIPGFDYATNGPIGDGYATITVKPAGTVTATGFTADNQAFTPQTAPVSGSGRWPVYAPLYVTAGGGHNGVVIGWVQFTSKAPTATFSGDLNWIKTGWTNTYYAGGFTNLNVTAPGSVFTAPANLGFTTATATYSSGEFGSLLTDILTVTGGTTVTATNSHPLGKVYKYTPGTGVLTVSRSTNNASITMNPIKGAYLQNQNYIGGYFVGTNQDGQLLIQH